MSVKPVITRARARRDIEEAVDRYVEVASERVAIGFVDALQAAFRQIAAHPASGSPRYAHELNLAGLRSVGLRRYPHLVFYLERDDPIDVWRVLDGRRDIPAWMRAPEP